MNGATPLLSHMPSWCGRENIYLFHFILTVVEIRTVYGWKRAQYLRVFCYLPFQQKIPR